MLLFQKVMAIQNEYDIDIPSFGGRSIFRSLDIQIKLELKILVIYFGNPLL